MPPPDPPDEPDEPLRASSTPMMTTTTAPIPIHSHMTFLLSVAERIDHALKIARNFQSHGSECSAFSISYVHPHVGQRDVLGGIVPEHDKHGVVSGVDSFFLSLG